METKIEELLSKFEAHQVENKKILSEGEFSIIRDTKMKQRIATDLKLSHNKAGI